MFADNPIDFPSEQCFIKLPGVVLTAMEFDEQFDGKENSVGAVLRTEDEVIEGGDVVDGGLLQLHANKQQRKEGEGIMLQGAVSSCIFGVPYNKKQQQMEESIYNIIPKEYTPPPKEPLYKSKFPPTVKPTGSTFCNHTTSKPIAANLGGEFGVGLQAHTEYGNTKTFGHLKGDRKPAPDSFLKKATGTMGNQTLPPVRNFSYDCKHKKDSVPRVQEKPVQGLSSNKNFIVTNAIENILSVAKKSEEPVDWQKKKDFGKTPEYLNRIKENIQNEYTMIQNLHEQNSEEKQCLSEDEVREIREGLKRKWDEINREYQKMTHVRLVDTTGSKRRKENYEKQLGEIEADIKKLNKLYVFVD